MKVLIEVPEGTIALGINYVHIVEGEKKDIKMGCFGMYTREIYENVLEAIDLPDIPEEGATDERSEN